MGRHIYSEEVDHGDNMDRGKYSDANFVRCSRCKWICNTQRDSERDEGSYAGWGNKFEQVNTSYVKPLTYSNSKVEYNGSELQDPIRQGGCPQCGTYLYR
jgi:hypothetical protein